MTGNGFSGVSWDSGGGGADHVLDGHDHDTPLGRKIEDFS